MHAIACEMHSVKLQGTPRASKDVAIMYNKHIQLNTDVEIHAIELRVKGCIG